MNIVMLCERKRPALSPRPGASGSCENTAMLSGQRSGLSLSLRTRGPLGSCFSDLPPLPWVTLFPLIPFDLTSVSLSLEPAAKKDLSFRPSRPPSPRSEKLCLATITLPSLWVCAAPLAPGDSLALHWASPRADIQLVGRSL